MSGDEFPHFFLKLYVAPLSDKGTKYVDTVLPTYSKRFYNSTSPFGAVECTDRQQL